MHSLFWSSHMTIPRDFGVMVHWRGISRTAFTSLLRNHCVRKMAASKLAVLGAILTVQLGFGLNPVVIKKFAALSGTDPLIFCLYRDSLAFPLLLLCARLVGGQLDLPEWKELPVFALLGMTGIFANQLLYIIGLYNAGPNLATIICNSVPVCTALLAIILGTELFHPEKWFSWFKLVGIVAAVVGAIEMVLVNVSGSVVAELPQEDTSKEQAKMNKPFGFLCLTGCCMCMATYLLLQKILIQKSTSQMARWKDQPLAVTAWAYGFGASYLVVSSLFYAKSIATFSTFYIPFEAVYSLTYAVLITSVTCYLCLGWANFNSSSTLVAAFWPLQVPVTVVASYFITGDQLKLSECIGMVLIVAGLLAVVYSTHKENELESTRLALSE